MISGKPAPIRAPPTVPMGPPMSVPTNPPKAAPPMAVPIPGLQFNKCCINPDISVIPLGNIALIVSKRLPERNVVWVFISWKINHSQKCRRSYGGRKSCSPK